MNKVKEIFSENGFSDEDIDKIIYCRDSFMKEGDCYGVVFPTSAMQIHDLIRYANRRNLPLTIRGGATNSVGGCVPHKSLVVDMAKMNKVLKVGEDYVIVEAGVNIYALNKFLGEKEVPIRPYNYQNHTIGGMIATNVRDFKNLERNRISDWLIEIEFIDGSGKYIKAKRDILKNVYGQEGLSGIIVCIKLKIRKKEKTTIKILKFPTITSLINEVPKLKNNPNVVALEYFCDFSSELLELGEGCHIFVEFSNASGNIEEDVNEVWKMRKRLPYFWVMNRYVETLDVQIPYEKIGQFLYWMRKNKIPCYGHLGNNEFYLCFKKDSKRIDEARQFINVMNGKIGKMFGIGIKNKDQISESQKQRLLVLKAQYDPKNILNRGVMID